MTRGPLKYILLLYMQICRTQIISPSSINKAGSGQVLYVPCPNAANCLDVAEPGTLPQCKALETGAVMTAVIWLVPTLEGVEVRQTVRGQQVHCMRSLSTSPTVLSSPRRPPCRLLTRDYYPGILLHCSSRPLRFHFCQLAEFLTWQISWTRALGARRWFS